MHGRRSLPNTGARSGTMHGGIGDETTSHSSDINCPGRCDHAKFESGSLRLSGVLWMGDKDQREVVRNNASLIIMLMAFVGVVSVLVLVAFVL